MQKILIITYYWPPSGGAGVQRWLKLTKYLNNFGIIPHVLTVDEASASYTQLDNDLLKDISPDVKIYKTKSFEPINYYGKIVGKDNIPTAGFSNVNNKKFSQKAINALRSNLFIPDPRKGWNKYAIRKAKEIIEKENINLIITTSPPHSTQLIGLKLKKKYNLQWFADLRDPWTDIYYYEILGHSFISKRIDQHFEKKVLKNADKILTVSNGLKTLFSSKLPGISDKIDIVTNGFDHEDFEDLKKVENSVFTICYTGTMSDQYDLSALLKAIKKLQSDKNDNSIKLQIVGKASDSIKKNILENNINFEFIPTVPHGQINQFQKNADLLLLIIPSVKKSEGILTGKLFEYLATHNNILCLGNPKFDAAKIIDECNVGKTMESDNVEGITQYLQQELHRFHAKEPNFVNTDRISLYSRMNQAKDLSEMIKSALNSKENPY